MLTIERRLAKLEQELRLWRRGGLVAGCLLVIGGFAAADKATTFDVIEAREFRVIGESGAEAVTIGRNKDNGFVHLFERTKSNGEGSSANIQLFPHLEGSANSLCIDTSDVPFKLLDSKSGAMSVAIGRTAKSRGIIVFDDDKTIRWRSN